MTKHSVTILLTAAIDTKGVMFIKRSDPKIREGDYLNSLKQWLTATDYRIVFCENSGYDLTKIRECCGQFGKGRCEILSFEGNDYPKEFGKGYGEMKALQYACQNSQFIRESDYVVKATGRYYVKNIKKILDRLIIRDFFVAGDLKENLEVTDSRVFVSKPKFILDFLTARMNELNDSKGVYFEHILARAIHFAMSDSQKWLPLPDYPIVQGYVASTDTSSRLSWFLLLRKIIAHKLKNFLNDRSIS